MAVGGLRIGTTSGSTKPKPASAGFLVVDLSFPRLLAILILHGDEQFKSFAPLERLTSFLPSCFQLSSYIPPVSAGFLLSTATAFVTGLEIKGRCVAAVCVLFRRTLSFRLSRGIDTITHVGKVKIMKAGPPDHVRSHTTSDYFVADPDNKSP